MEALALVEGHPVLDLGGVFLFAFAAAEGRGALLEGKGEGAGLSLHVLDSITGDDVALDNELSIDIVPHVLGAEADLDVGAGQVVHAVPAQIEGVSPGAVVHIDRLAGDVLSRQDLLGELRRLLVLQDGVPVLIERRGDGDLGPQAGVEDAVPVAGLVLLRQLVDVFRDLLLPDLELAVPDLQPLKNGLEIQCLGLASEGVGDGLAGHRIEQLQLFLHVLVRGFLVRRDVHGRGNGADDLVLAVLHGRLGRLFFAFRDSFAPLVFIRGVSSPVLCGGRCRIVSIRGLSRVSGLSGICAAGLTRGRCRSGRFCVFRSILLLLLDQDGIDLAAQPFLQVLFLQQGSLHLRLDLTLLFLVVIEDLRVLVFPARCGQGIQCDRFFEDIRVHCKGQLHVEAVAVHQRVNDGLVVLLF